MWQEAEPAQAHSQAGSPAADVYLPHHRQSGELTQRRSGSLSRRSDTGLEARRLLEVGAPGQQAHAGWLWPGLVQCRCCTLVLYLGRLDGKSQPVQIPTQSLCSRVVRPQAEISRHSVGWASGLIHSWMAGSGEREGYVR
jgi:hypothetical protein